MFQLLNHKNYLLNSVTFFLDVVKNYEDINTAVNM